MELQFGTNSSLVSHRGTSKADGKRDFLDIRFDKLEQEAVLASILTSAPSRSFSYLVTPNVDHVLRIHSDGTIAAAYRSARFCLNDSKILSRLARASGIALPAIPGADLVAALLRHPRLAADTSILIVGGPEGMDERLGKIFGLSALAQHRPPMGLLRNPAAMAQAAAAVEASGAQFVLLAIGSPQQELLAAQIARRGKARGVGLCIGAGLDFLVGTQRRAPLWMQRRGLEWAFRLASEPKRMWRRYLVDGPKIFAIFFSYVMARNAT